MPVIVLHHLTDENDVSWSKDIKRDADILLYMVNDDKGSIMPTKENEWIGRWVVDLDIRKNRDGEAGYSVKTEFKKRVQTFVEEG